MSKRALITGASSGIGLEFARVFAENGYALVLVARDSQKLDALAAALESAHGTDTLTVQKDLSKPGAAAGLFEQLGDMRVDILINNAGAGTAGPFLETSLDAEIAVVDLNITALTTLTKLAAIRMAGQGGGKILNVASTGAYLPGPFIAVYYATKAYVLSLTQAVRHELAGSGVTVSALCPGPTATDFSRRAGRRALKGAMSARAVAQRGYRGLQKGRRVIIPGVWNKLAVFISKLLPGSLCAYLLVKIQRKLSKAS